MRCILMQHLVQEQKNVARNPFRCLVVFAFATLTIILIAAFLLLLSQPAQAGFTMSEVQSFTLTGETLCRFNPLGKKSPSSKPPCSR